MKPFDSRHLFDINVVRRDIRGGSLLVAEPFLREGYFNHAVITLVDYVREQGAMGVVMNNQLPGTTLQSLIDGITVEEPVPVYCGGPVSSDRLFFMHTLGALFPEASEVSPGLYISGDFPTVVDYVNSGYPLEGRLRFFVGYSGWERGQLEKECMDKVWAVSEPVLPAEDALTGGEDAYWHKVVRLMGPSYRDWLRHPKNPSLN